jgi:hypothetical protein
VKWGSTGAHPKRAASPQASPPLSPCCCLQIARLALPRHSIDMVDMGEYVAPINRIEQVIQAAWEEVLAVEPGSIGTQMSFFEVRLALISADTASLPTEASMQTSDPVAEWWCSCTLPCIRPRRVCHGLQIGGNSLKAGIALSKVRQMLNAPEIPGELATRRAVDLKRILHTSYASHLSCS